ncbi:MAG: hypothetical protein QOD30_2403 [Actinomycetota bacterium]|nr:hypothetical protein [Actinomycetota bacterium]
MLRRRAVEAVDERLRRLERRLEDVEDTVSASLGVDRIDDLSHRVELLALSAVTHDDVLEVRMDAARLAAELTRVRAELQYEIDRLATTLDDLVEPEPRRAAGWR